MESTARVSTERPARYIKQLAEHFGNRIETAYSDEGGTLNFAFGRCELIAEDGAIVLRAEAEDDESLTRVEDVTGRHLERFGQKHELAVAWRRA